MRPFLRHRATVRHRAARALAGAWLALAAQRAPATVYFVDGACPGSGTGTSLACGPTGPFRTIGSAVEAMEAGDTVNVRGAHDGFSGVYFEQINLTGGPGGLLPGKALACTVDQRCVIQGCRAPACPADEEPVVRGMQRRDDWVALGGGVHARSMEATPEEDGQGRDAFDPHMLLQGSATPLAALAYAGDAVPTPAEGEWSYDPGTQRIFVNPVGDADPADVVFVPHFSFHAHLRAPSANVTLAHLVFEGTRGRSIEASGPEPLTVPGLVLRAITQRYVVRHFVLGGGVPDLLIEDSRAEYGCRGWSWAQPQSDGCFGYRVFGAHGSVIRRNVMAHLGAAGRRNLSSPGPSGRDCPWCDAPWNETAHTDVSATGLCYQVKQTDGALISDNVCEDIRGGGLSLDVSRRVVVEGNVIRRTYTGIAVRDFTPNSGCPTPDPSRFCFNREHVIRANRFDTNGGREDEHVCAIMLHGGDQHETGGTFFAKVYNNVVSRPSGGGICLRLDAGVASTTDLSIWNNTVAGTHPFLGTESVAHGLMLQGVTQGVAVRNNLVSGLSGNALVVSTNALAGLTLDAELLHDATPCAVRWNVPDAGFPTGGTCGTLPAFRLANPGQEMRGLFGTPSFVAAGAAPPDLHLLPGSAGLRAGLNIATEFSTDVDGDPRPVVGPWDIGADHVPAASTTTSSSSTSSSSSSSTSTTSSTSTSSSSTTSSSTSSSSTSSLGSTSNAPSTSTSTSSTSAAPISSTTTSSTTAAASTSSPTPTSSEASASSSTSTTSSTSAPDATTTTAPPLEPERVHGRRLLLTERRAHPDSRRVVLVGRDRESLHFDVAAQLRTLQAQGGMLRMVEIGGAFDASWPLPASGWRLVDPDRPNRGVRYDAAAGPVTNVVVVPGERLVIRGAGSEIQPSLSRDPGIIAVELRAGTRLYCLAFGGRRRRFAAGRQLLRVNAKRPTTCPLVLP